MELIDRIAAWPLARRKALYRVAKTRGRAFFRDPRMMAALRKTLGE